jgi:tetratricopeptide (TPR) repeat protein
VKSRLIAARVLLLVGGAAAATGSFVPAPLAAQRGQPPAPRFMVTAFRAADKTLGCQTSDAVRDRLTEDNPPRILIVISKDDINKTLEQSGYLPCDPLTLTDAKQLANQFHAEEFLDGAVTKTATGFRLDARLFLARDNTYSQPIGVIDGARLGEIASKVSKQLDEVRKQLDDEKECYMKTRMSQTKDAIQKARDGMKRYPKAVLARVCLMQALDAAKAPREEIVAVARDILTIDSTSRPALQITSKWYKDKGDTANYINTLLQTVASDPTNAATVDFVVNELALLKQASRAVPIIKLAMRENTGDSRLLFTAWKIFYTIENWKEMIPVGDELVRVDTTFADSTYYYRTAQAFGADSQPAKVAETFAKASQRFNKTSYWLMLLAQSQRQAGQIQQALDTYKKALAVDPKTKGVYLQIARAYNEQNQPDTALIYIRQGAAAGDSIPLLAQYALSIGNAAYKKAQGSKSRDDYLAAIKVIQLSDSLAPSSNAGLLIGASALSVAVSALQDASNDKSCDLAKMSVEYFGIVNIMVPKFGKANPQQAGSIMGVVTQYGPVAEKLQKQLCK